MIHLKREINKNIKKLNRLKNDIEKILLKLKNIKTNQFIYENCQNNNFKNYYFYYLNYIKEKTEMKCDINIIDLIKRKEDINSVFSEYNISKKAINTPIRILNIDQEGIKKIVIDKKEIDYCKEIIYY
jgi:hypothetical protein